MTTNKTYRQKLKKQKGVALIVVMLIVALITVLAAQMSGRLQLNVARTLNIKANNQAYWYALGAEQFAQQSLSTLKTLTGENINLSQPWAQPFEYPVEGGVISAELVDMQSCFNLNAVRAATGVTGNSPAQSAFKKLLESYITDSFVVDTLLASLTDWIDEDSEPSQDGAEDPEYESQARPYLAANNSLSHLSELRLIYGMDQVIQLGAFDVIKNALCVLPEDNLKVNVNTITPENAVVLASLLGETVDTGSSIIGSRPEEGFKSIDDFFALGEVSALQLTDAQKSWFDVTTTYFKLNTVAKYQGSQFRLSTIFRLDNDGIIVVSREFGGAF